MFDTRSYLKEEMDNYPTNGVMLNDSLSKLSLINKYLGNTSITLKAVIEILERKPKEIVHIVDLGCGAGDNLRAIGDWCFENGREIKLTGIDGNEHILNYAKAKKSKVKINYKYENILDTRFELEMCDIVISSHFIYRFTDAELIDFISRSSDKVRSTIIFSELQRHVVPYVAFSIFGRLFSLNAMVLQDGLKAIKNSFRKRELRDILKQVDVSSYNIKWKWAFRYLIIIKC